MLLHSNQTMRVIQTPVGLRGRGERREECEGNISTIAFTNTVELAKRRHHYHYPKPYHIRPQQESDGTFTYSPRAAVKSIDMGTDFGMSHSTHPKRKSPQPTRVFERSFSEIPHLFIYYSEIPRAEPNRWLVHSCGAPSLVPNLPFLLPSLRRLPHVELEPRRSSFFHLCTSTS
jgi:hypothetical protein